MKHLETAERLHFFLAQQKLSRERFLQEIQHAITRSSLLSLLNGHRRPARTFALLLEWKWGFRADYLLQGKGEAWTSAGTGKSGLSPLEQEVVGFMRESPSNAQEIQGSLARAMLWNRLYSRMDKALERLGTLDASDRQYPALATMTLEECWRLAAIHQQYGALVQSRRVLRLTQRFMRRFVLPAASDNPAMSGIAHHLESRIRAVETQLRTLHEVLLQQESASLSIDCVLDRSDQATPDVIDEMIRQVDMHRTTLQQAGIAVDAFIDRLRSHLATTDMDAWSALLMSRLQHLEAGLPKAGNTAVAADHWLEFRRLMGLLSR